MANGLSVKQTRILVQDLAKQNCKVKPTSKGYWIGFPDGSSYTFHMTTSDSRSIKNMRAAVIRSGCTWLMDGGKR